MKKTLSLMLFIALLFIALPVTGSALNEDARALTAYETVAKGFSEFSDYIDISAYNLTASDVKKLFSDVKYNEPMLFNVGLSYMYYFDGPKILAIEPEYIMSKSEYDTAVSYVELQLKAIVDTLPSGLDDYEKALYFHDYLCLNFCYDTTYVNRDIFTFLRDKTGVCSSYTLLYDELLSRVEIESSAVSSISLEHVWNEIKLDGKWYHVDVTWDDPVSSLDVINEGYYAYAWHEEFLESDSDFRSSHSDDFEAKYPCTDTSFDNDSWKTNYFPVGFANGGTYILLDDYICTLDVKNGTTSREFFANVEFFKGSNGKSYFNQPHFGSYNNKLIYMNGESFLAYDPIKKTSNVLFTPETDDAIVAFYVSDRTLNYVLSSTSLVEDGVKYTYLIPTEKRMKGDIDGNGAVSTADYILLKRVYMGTYSYDKDDISLYDLDVDGKIGVADYIIVKRIYMGTYKID